MNKLAVKTDVGPVVRVPLLDLGAQYEAIRDEIRSAVDRVIDSQVFILGPEVADFEEELRSYCGGATAVGMSSGTDALLAALMALGIGPGDEVITTPYSFFATAGAITRVGARPVFIDIDPSTFNLDCRLIEEAITDRTRALLPVHLYGRCADMKAIEQVATAAGLAVIEDAAQALGARDDYGRLAGSMGQIGCFSFFPSKNLGGFGDGGMACSNDPNVAERLRVLRVHGSSPKYYHSIIGGNFRLDAIQAAVLRIKLRSLNEWTQARRRNAERYRSLFSDAALTSVVALPDDVPGHIYNQFVVRVPRRDALQAHLAEAGVSTEVYYPLPLHMQECFAGLGYAKGDFPEAETASAESLALPIYPELSMVQQEHVVQSIAHFYSE